MNAVKQSTMMMRMITAMKVITKAVAMSHVNEGQLLALRFEVLLHFVGLNPGRFISR